MNWTAETPTARFAELETTVGKAGASESVAIIAVIWGIVILA